MDCHVQDALNREFLLRFRKKIFTDRIPVSGSMDLTTRCNFNCIHCYHPENARKHPGQDNELDTQSFLRLIDDITEAGCLNLLFSGGEPLLRKDFSEIYSHAKNKGMLVTVFSNGSTVTDDHIKLFLALPPARVEISIYGASPQTYEAITGVSDSYHRALAGIDKLHGNGIRIALKTVLMTINRHELQAMEIMARERGADFRFDTVIIPRLDGDPSPLLKRLTPDDAVAMEFQNQKRAQEWKQFWKEQKKNQLDDRLFLCGAGRMSFHITSRGRLQPCLMVPHPSWDLKQGNFLNGWESELIKLNDVKINQNSPCHACDLISLCGYCPPALELETGSQNSCPDFLCRLGHLRHQKITSNELCLRCIDKEKA